MLNILMPVDFQERSLHALSLASHMTKALHAKLIMLHVIEPLGGDATMFVDDGVLDTEREDASRRFEELAKSADMDRSLLETKIDYGFPMEKTLQVIKECNISLVVMGTSGSHSKLEDWIGSNSYKIVKNANCAVLTVPVEARCQDIKKIALAVDLRSKENIHLISILRHLLRHFNAEIYFLHVCPDKHISFDDDVHSDAVLHLAEEFKGYKHRFVTIQSTHVAEALNQYALDHGIDLIALSPSEHNFFSGWFKNLTTKDMVLHGQVPMLTLPANY